MFFFLPEAHSRPRERSKMNVIVFMVLASLENESVYFSWSLELPAGVESIIYMVKGGQSYDMHHKQLVNWSQSLRKKETGTCMRKNPTCCSSTWPLTRWVPFLQDIFVPAPPPSTLCSSVSFLHASPELDIKNVSLSVSYFLWSTHKAEAIG